VSAPAGRIHLVAVDDLAQPEPPSLVDIPSLSSITPAGQAATDAASYREC
jgi:hypothetical protein